MTRRFVPEFADNFMAMDLDPPRSEPAGGDLVAQYERGCREAAAMPDGPGYTEALEHLDVLWSRLTKEERERIGAVLYLEPLAARVVKPTCLLCEYGGPEKYGPHLASGGHVRVEALHEDCVRLGVRDNDGACAVSMTVAEATNLRNSLTEVLAAASLRPFLPAPPRRKS